MLDIMLALQPIGILFQRGDYQAAAADAWNLWEPIPEPKETQLNAYLVIEYGVAISLKLEDLDQAKKWTDFAPPFRSIRHDMGEVEFLTGKVQFERGEFEEAKQNFEIAASKSEWRAFQGEDPKYRNLV